ncbi:MAG: type II secretion system F family protein [Hungatella sp.]|jgi:tight adherence protein C|nr:type II secretion system F family protein [Hungatella sp.]
MINWFQLGMMVCATPFVLFWLFLYMKYKNTFHAYTDNLSSEEFRMPELFFIGMGFMNQVKYNLRTRKGRARIKEISEIKGQKYAEYYYYVIKGATFTYIWTLLPFVLILGAMSDNPMMLLLGICVMVLLVRYLEKDINDKLEERREELLLDLPQVLSKMALLINSGMVMREAWVKVSQTGERALYQEMRIASGEMANGASDLEAFRNFADRCSVRSIRKVTSTLIQNMQKGNQELSYFLEEMSREMWEEKKNLVRQKGETAGTKLLLPIAMIFGGILMLILVPVFIGGM